MSAAPGRAGRAAARLVRRCSLERSKPAAARRAGGGSAGCGLLGLPDAGATSVEGFLAANVAKPAAVVTDGWVGYADLPARGYHDEPIDLSKCWGECRVRACRPSTWSWASPSRWLLGTYHGCGGQEACPGLPRRVRVPLQPPHSQEHQPPLRAVDRAGARYQTGYLPRHRSHASSSLTVVENFVNYPIVGKRQL